MTAEKLNDQLAKILSAQHNTEQITKKISDWIGDQPAKMLQRADTLIEFAICFPNHVKKVKGASTGMTQVLHHDDSHD